MRLRTTIRAAHRRDVNGAHCDRSDRGDTLIEILMTLVVLSITVLGLIIAFSTSLSASVVHRHLAANDVVLRSAAEEAISQIQQQPSTSPTATPYQSCATTYPSTDNFGAPSTYRAAVSSVEYWSAAGADFVPSPCTANAPELVNLTVTNIASGTSVYTNFVVDARGQNSASAFSVTAISPATLVAGTEQVVSITGTGFVNGDHDTVSFSGSGVTAGPLSFPNTGTNSVIVQATVSSSASGTYSVTVTDPTSGTSATSGPILTVTSPLSVTSVSPSAQPQGASSQPLTLTGTGFGSGATVSFSGSGVTAGPTSGSGNTLNFNVSITNNAAPGARSITVTNSGGVSATSGLIFTVNGTASTVLDVNLMIGSVDGTSKRAWDAMVTIDVVDSNDNAIAGVTVTGTWDNNQSTATSTCTTNVTGSCKVEDGVPLNLGANNSSVTFTVSGLSATGYTYNSGGNFANPAAAKVSQP
jgi:hypothetical protein